MNLPNLRPVPLAELEAVDPELADAKHNRSFVEYLFTCTSAWTYYLISRPEIDQITYLDADLYFFADPQMVFDEMGKGSIYIIPHRFSPQHEDQAEHGIYNVGLLSFRKDEAGVAALR